MWGREAGDRVHVVFENGRVVEISSRLDLRAFSEPFARGVLRLARHCGCLLITREGRLLLPEYDALLAAVRASNELRFVLNPREFFKALADSRINP